MLLCFILISFCLFMFVYLTSIKNLCNKQEQIVKTINISYYLQSIVFNECLLWTHLGWCDGVGLGH